MGKWPKFDQSDKDERLHLFHFTEGSGYSDEIRILWWKIRKMYAHQATENRTRRKIFLPVVLRNAVRTAWWEPAIQSGEWFRIPFRYHIYFCTVRFLFPGPSVSVYTESHSSGLLSTRLTTQCYFQGPKKVRFPGPNPLSLALVMDLPASKALGTVLRGRINHRSNSYNCLSYHILCFYETILLPDLDGRKHRQISPSVTFGLWYPGSGSTHPFWTHIRVFTITWFHSSEVLWNRICMFLRLPDPLVTSTDPAPAPDPSIVTLYQCSGSGSRSVESVCFVTPGSASGSVWQRYRSKDPDSHPDP